MFTVPYNKLHFDALSYNYQIRKFLVHVLVAYTQKNVRAMKQIEVIDMDYQANVGEYLCTKLLFYTSPSKRIHAKSRSYFKLAFIELLSLRI